MRPRNGSSAEEPASSTARSVLPDGAYAIGVGHLSDRIGGAGPLQASFPPDENGLTKDDRIAIQRGLAARGYDIGTIDGVIGAKTEAAIGDFQQRQGLPATGIANAELLALMR